MTALSVAPSHDLWAAANRVDRRRARSRQVALGASNVGDCMRQAAYIHHRIKPTDDEGDKRAAIMGGWHHKGALGVLAKEFGAITEVGLADPRLRGHADAYYPDAALVEDVKTKRNSGMLDKIVRYGPPRKELFQVHLYAYMVRKGLFSAREKRLVGEQLVLDVRLRYIARDGGDEYVFEQPYDSAIAKEAWEWLEQATAYTDPDDAPRGHDGPGLSYVCDSCPFRTRCWGEFTEDGPYPQRKLIEGREDIEAALTEYARGRDLEAEGKDLKAKARRMLDQAEPAIYGDLKLAWTGGNGTPADVPDVDAMKAMLKAAGLAVPMKPGQKKRPSISVTAAPRV